MKVELRAVVRERVVARRRWIRIAIMVTCVGFVPGLFAKAYATDAQSIADARCVLVGMHVAFVGSPQQRPAGLMIAMYYFGRLDERSPHGDTERLIEAEANKMTPADYQAGAARCGKALGVKGQELQAIGAALARKGQRGAPRK